MTSESVIGSKHFEHFTCMLPYPLGRPVQLHPLGNLKVDEDHACITAARTLPLPKSCESRDLTGAVGATIGAAPPLVGQRRLTFRVSLDKRSFTRRGWSYSPTSATGTSWE